MVATLAIRVLLDAQAAGSELRNLGTNAEGAGSKLKNIAAATAAFAGITAVVGKAVSAASNLQQSMGGVEAVFKSSAGQVKQWGASAADSLGLSQSAYQDLAVLIGSQLKNAGTAMEDLAPKTDSLIRQGADLAAMYGGTTAEAVSALSSALKGERDPIERYGITLNDAAIQGEIMAQGLDTSTAAAQNAAKATATLSLITKQSADAQGAAAREIDSYASVQQRVSAVWENTMAQVGTELLPALSALGTAFADAAPLIGDLVTPLAGLLGVVLDLPTPVLAAVGAFAAFKLLGIGGFLTDMIGKFRTAGSSAAGFGNALKSVISPGALAFAGLAAGIVVVTQMFAEAEAKQKAFASGVSDLANSIIEAGGQWTGAVQDFRKAQVEQSEGFQALISHGADYSTAMDLFSNDNDKGKAAMLALQGVMGDLSQDQQQNVVDMAAQTGAAKTMAQSKMEATAAEQAAAQAAEQSGTATAAQTELLNKNAEAELKTATETAKAAAANTEMRTALEGVSTAASAATAEVQFFVLQMQQAAGMNVTMDQAAQGMNAALRGTAAAFKASNEAGETNLDSLVNWNAATLTSTESGDKLYAALLQMQSGYATATVAAYNQAGGAAAGQAAIDAAAGAAQTSYDAFIQMATGATGSSEAAIALARNLGIVDAQHIDPKTFSVIAETQTADKAVADLQAAAIPPKTVEVGANVTVAQSGYRDLIQQRLDNTVKVDADPKAARSTVDDFVNAKRTTTPVAVTADPAQATSTTNAFTSQARTTTVQVGANTTAAQGAITAVVNEPRTKTITVAANTGPFDSAIASILGRSYSVTVNVSANTAAASAAIAAVPRTVNVAPAPAAVQSMMLASESPEARAVAAVSSAAATDPPPAMRRLNLNAAPPASSTVAQPIEINVSGALDPDAVARQIRSLLDRLDRRSGGTTVRGLPT